MEAESRTLKKFLDNLLILIITEIDPPVSFIFNSYLSKLQLIKLELLNIYLKIID